MRYNTATLSNGLRIIHRMSDSPVVYCGYQIAAGTRNEEKGAEGLAHFCEHLTFKGTRRRTALQILSHLESVGGDLNAFTTKESTTFYAAIPREHTTRAVDLLTDIVFDSIFPQHEIEKEAEVVCDEIESYNDSPIELIYDEFENLLFQGHPLGHSILGSAENVRRFTTEDALRFTRHYYRPDNAVFFAYGNLNFEQLKKKLERLSKDIPSSTVITPPSTVITPPSTVIIPTSSIIEKHTHQAHVMTGCVAYPIGHPDRIALYLLNNMLGGPGMSARLNVILRERHGLVYTVESSMVCYGDTGIWNIYFGCDPHDVSRCLRLIRRELNRLMHNPLTVRQLNAAKRQIKGQISIACDNREQFALDFSKSYLFNGKERNIEELYRQIDAITPEQIHKVANELFEEHHLKTLIIQ